MEIENWINKGQELVREFTFENQTQLAEFVLMVARFSDEVNHHADMQISQCRNLRISISTHDQNSLTDLDYKWVIDLNERIKAYNK